MSRKARTLYAIIFVEILLAGIWYYLTMQSVAGGGNSGAPRVIGQMMGMAMGGFFGFGVLLFLLAVKADNDQAKRDSADRDPR